MLVLLYLVCMCLVYLTKGCVCVCVASARQSVVARQTFALVSKWPLTVFSKREQCPLLVLHQLGHQPDSRPDEQHPQCGVQQEVD